MIGETPREMGPDKAGAADEQEPPHVDILSPTAWEDHAVTLAIGNAYDKYGTANPVARRLVAGFLRELDAMVDAAGPAELLDVGCGEGIVTARMAARARARRSLGLDRDSEMLRGHWARYRSTVLDFRVADAHDLPFDDGAWDTVCAIEVLDLVEDARAVIAELARVARHHVLVSVPRQPVWRILNVARGAYLGSGGMSPGSVRSFSSRSFAALCRTAGEPVAVAKPFPWTIVLLRVG